MNSLEWLQNWCIDNLPEKPQNTPSIKIDTLDNPGWAVDIHLTDTPFENRKFDTIDIETTEHNWVYCKVENKVFEGRGGPRNLGDLLDTFRNWVAEGEQVSSGIIDWMQEWYLRHCDEDWEHSYGIHIDRIDGSEWIVKIDIEETELESKSFIEQREKKDDTDWYHCWVSEAKFFGKGGPRNLVDILEVFQKWATSV